ncbi:MAG: heparinase II/III family protein, partial [Gorillibacterium sp.]|nr:heparinase II/III family protein [Gorillibacterium sp.]
MILLTQEEIRTLRDRIEQEDKLGELWKCLLKRVEKQTHSPGLVQPGDTIEWWHLVWERISDAAFVYAVNGDERIGQWVRDAVLEIVNRPGTDWHGPAFRGRGNPQYGVLETSHVGLAVAEAYSLCTPLFSEMEQNLILNKLREECQLPCKRSLESVMEKQGNISNWFMVLLNGFGTSSIVLNDREAVLETVRYYQTAARMFNSDSYGESLQYWNFAAHHLSNLNEMLKRYDAELAKQADLMCYARCIPWAVQSHLYMKPLGSSEDTIFPRAINFGDSAAVFRPSANLLLQVAKHAKEQSPVLAGLARWLFEETYSVLELEQNELATFGFINSYQFMSLIHYSDAAASLSPEEAGLPLVQVFEAGNVIVRDGWKNKATVLGTQAGYEVMNVTSHNHMDQGSFNLAHRNERFFIDPGHACYRLETQAKSIATSSHNTWTFQVEGQQQPLIQQTIEGVNFWNPTDSLVQRKFVSSMDGITIIRSDLAQVYGQRILKAERTWITAFPHVMMIIDRIVSDEPVKTQAHFMLN